jgi:hypothetical protein
MAGFLKRDGKAGVGERIVRGQESQSLRRGDGGLELLCIAQGANQAMVRLNVAGIGGDGSAEGLGCACRISGSEQVESLLRMFVAVGWFEF